MSQGGAHLKPKAGKKPKVEIESRVERGSAAEREPRVTREPRVEREPRVAREPRVEREPRADREPRVNREPRGERAPRAEREPAERRPRSSGPAPRSKRPKKKKRRTLRTILIVFAVLVVTVFAIGVGIFFHFYGLMNTSAKPSPTPDVSSVAPSQTPDNSTPEPTETPEPTPPPLTEEEKAAMAEMQLRDSLQAEAEEIIYSNDVYNILLIGADGRGHDLERSDAMILLSVNKATKTMWLTSLMRDTQVSLTKPGGSFYGTGHLNHATREGGVDMLVATIESEKNFAIHIDNWALVNFLDFAEVAELLGPITVTVTAKEAAEMNLCIREVCRLYDEEYELTGVENTRYRSYFPEKDGTYEITDGVQILGYCRERHINGDTGRSRHQREALMQMWENVKKMNLMQQYELAEKIMSIITTDMSWQTCASLLLQAPTMLTYDIQTQQCPAIGAMTKGMDGNNTSTYFADFTVNRNFLRATIYNDDTLTRADLTSGWTGTRICIWDPETDTVP